MELSPKGNNTFTYSRRICFVILVTPLVVIACLVLFTLKEDDMVASAAITVAGLFNPSSSLSPFTLRHAFYHEVQGHFALDNDLGKSHYQPQLQMYNFSETYQQSLSSQLEIKSFNRVFRGNSATRKLSAQHGDQLSSLTHPDEVKLTPNTSDKATVVNLAKMTSDAYVTDPSVPEWLNLTDGFNRSHSFGWDEEGLRGHVFVDAMNETVIVAFKGTTVVLGPGRSRDRINDNLLFSCCCADQRNDRYYYGPVCDCRSDTYQCNSTCLTQEVAQGDRYYGAALEVMLNMSSIYPNANFWTVGHSLGGSIASLMGLTFGLPAVSFEAPPERLPAERLGLGNANSASTHFGNTADPVFMGACNGFSSACAVAGFAFESQCFTGKRCIYDTVTDKGWHLSIVNHRINTVIEKVLSDYEDVPKCEIDVDCVDCYEWDYHI